MRMYNVILGALAQALPQAVPAAGAGQSAIVVLSTPDTEGSRKIAVVEPMGGGGGGQYDMDGVDGIDHASGFLKNTPIESLEQHIDIFVQKYELKPNTAGSGYHRGGHAIQLDFEIIKPDSIVTARGMERLRFQPWGLAGGKAGALGKVMINSSEEEQKEIPKIEILRPEQGQVVSITSPGGGGWGNPLEREAELILVEVESGLLSIDLAKDQYGVVLTTNSAGKLVIDQEETKRIRNEKSKEEVSSWDFGEEREKYEAKWTAEASSKLAVLLRKLPANQRSHYKHLAHKHFDEQDSIESLDGKIIEDFLAKVTSKY
jgi:N-methylhydantoinase B